MKERSGKKSYPLLDMQNSIRNKRTPYNQWIRDGRAMRQAFRDQFTKNRKDRRN